MDRGAGAAGSGVDNDLLAVRGPHDRRMDVDEVLRSAGPRATVSHELAAKAWGIELVEDGDSCVTVPRNRSRIAVPGWRIHRHDLLPGEVELVDGVRTTGPLRTVLDLCRVLPFVHAVVAADSAMRLTLVHSDELVSALTAVRGRGAERLRRVAGGVDPASGSVLESLLRVLLWSSLLPRPVSQYVVRDQHGAFLARVDFCWPALRLVVEADGFAYHSDRAAYRRDRDRLNDLERLGWRVLRFTWEDVVSRPEHVLGLISECLAGPAREFVC